MPAFDAPVALLKISGVWPGPLESSPYRKLTLGKAINLVQRQPAKDRWRFSVIGDEGLMTFPILERLAISEEYKRWRTMKR